MEHTAWLPLLIFLAAVLYSSAGQGGGSGYLAAMALIGVAPEMMKPSALALNILVAGVGMIRFYKAGILAGGALLPFAVPAVPLAFVGGALPLPDALYKQIVGAILIAAAIGLLFPRRSGVKVNDNANADAASIGDVPPADAPLANQPLERSLPLGDRDDRAPSPADGAPYAAAMFCGGVIGLLAGLTGTGGGIFLVPLLLYLRWATPRQAAGMSAAFIFVTSLAGIAGHLTRTPSLPPDLPYWAVAAVLGGVIGSELAARHLGNATLSRLSGLILLLAGGRLLLT